MVLSKVIANVQQVTKRGMALRHYEGKFFENDARYFTLKSMKKNPAVLPLVVIMAGAVVGLTGFIIYCGRTRTDISFNRNNPQLCESMDMMNPIQTKIGKIRQEYKAMPELAAGLDAIKNGGE